MPLESIQPILARAKAGGYAIAAFNPVDYASLWAIIEAAEAEQAPVIAQTSAKTVKYYGAAVIAQWAQHLAARVSVPVALHLDHGKDLKLIDGCLRAGWTSVMIDASDKPFEENIALTAAVIELARQHGAGVEAELGEIGGVEEDIVVDATEASLADPGKAAEFCHRLPGLAVFAPACGTAHGYYRSEPRVAFDLLDEIARRTGLPLALHGGTGLSDETIRRCIACGCAKVNISTNLKHIFINSFCEHQRNHPEDFEPLSVLKAQYDAMVGLARRKIRLCRGNGHTVSL